ncbi:MAG: nonstructural protein [Microviridae sp.]|nr:MAG: nonstructural protein [Microviridae sp.]
MILKIFSIYDIKSEAFSPPFFMSTAGEAVRAFKDLANDSNSMIGRHPSDFRLMCLGTFDNCAGTFAPNEQASLGFASDYVDLPSGAVPIGVNTIKAVS